MVIFIARIRKLSTMSWRKEEHKILVTKKIIYVLYILIIVCIGIATIIEKYKGTAFVGDNIYGAWWFALLWAMLAAASMSYMMHRKLYRRMAVMLLHVSFLVILAGALITHLTSAKGTVNLRMNTETKEYVDGDGVKHEFPFALRLKSFNIVNYPGTDAPLDYQSILQAQTDGETQDVTVSMNNIGNVEGYRLYQSSYDSDGQGVALGVYHDPYGIAVTYMGYLMLFVGIVCTLLSKKTMIRSLYKKATQPVVTLLALLFMAQNVSADELPCVDKDIAHKMGTVCVLYNNRICPVNTVATDFVTKLAGKASWNGYSADEIFVSWMIYYSPWEKQKLIRIKSKEVQELLGIDGQWASYSDFLDEYHEYKLKKALDDLKQGKGTISRKALMEADEKYNVVEMFYHGEMIKMFPYEGKGEVKWYVPGNQVLPKEIPVKEQFFIKQSMDFLTESIVTGQKERSLEIIAKIKLFQRDMIGEVLPSRNTINAEIAYNKMNTMKWPVFLTLMVGLIMCVVISASWKRCRERWFKIVTTGYVALLALYLTVLLCLRWWVGGHVPVSNGYETMQFMAWALLIMTMAMYRKFPIMIGFGTLVAAFCLLVAMIASGTPQITPLMPVLQSPLLSIHVMTVMCAYALFALQVLLGIQGLWLIHGNKTQQVEKNTALSQLLLYPAVFLLAIGIFLGAVWANVSWGTYWSWDPKETWALITFMVYAVPMHRESIGVFNKPRVYHIYIICAFLTVLTTYFGVNYILGGMHSYA